MTPAASAAAMTSLVADRAARLDDRADAGRRSAPAARRGTGRTRRRRPPSRRPGRPARATASRAESTRLTWPMPTPTVAPSRASRIALDFTARTARQANARSASVSADAGRAGGQRPGGRVVAGGVDPVGRLHQHAAGDLPGLDRRPGSTAGATQHAQVLLGGQHLDRAVLVGRRHDHLGEDLRDLLGQLDGDRRG